MTDPAPRVPAAAVLALCAALLVAMGRLAVDAWLVRPEPAHLPVQDGPPAAGAPGPFFLGIVDGLRAETAEPGPRTAMPFWASLAAEGTRGIALAGEPTLTACGVRTLLTGRNPDLKTAFRNFDAPLARGAVTRTLAERGLRLAHAGDASAWQMTADVHDPADVLAFPDQGPADQGGTDDRAFPFALARAQDPGVGVLTFHVVRPDHAAHRHGATGAEYAAACRAADEQMRRVVEAFRARRPDATILLAADHGVTARGTHGGGEGDARRAPFVLVGPRVARGVRLDIPQASLAPTLAAVLDLPMPPLAEAAPAVEATTLSPGERAAALDRYVRARLEVARGLGEGDLASAIEARRARVFAEGPVAAIEGLAAAYRDLEASAFASGGTAAAAAALLLCALGLATILGASAGTAAVPRPVLATGAAVGALAAAFAAPPFVAAGLVLGVGAILAGRRVPRTHAARTLAGAALVALPVAASAGLLLQDTVDASPDPASTAVRTAAAAAGLGSLLVAVLASAAGRRRLGDLVRLHPGVGAAVGGGLLGVVLSLRPFVDPLWPLDDVVAFLALVAVGFLVAGRRHAAPAVARIGVATTGLLLIGGGRALERHGGDWMLTVKGVGPVWTAIAALGGLLLLEVARRRARSRDDVLPLALGSAALVVAAAGRTLAPGAPVLWTGAVLLAALALVASAVRGGDEARLLGRLLAATALAVVLHERSDAQVAGFVLLAVGALAGAGLPAPATRTGIAALALAMLAIRAGVFHAMGFTESFSTIDTGAGVVPGGSGSVGARGQGVTPQVAANAALQVVKFALPWVVLLAAAARSFARARAPRRLSVLASDVGVGLAARGAALVALLWVLWRSSWWVEAAYPVFAFAAGELLLLLLAYGVVARAAPDRDPRRGEDSVRGRAYAGGPVPVAGS